MAREAGLPGALDYQTRVGPRPCLACRPWKVPADVLFSGAWWRFPCYFRVFQNQSADPAAGNERTLCLRDSLREIGTLLSRRMVETTGDLSRHRLWVARRRRVVVGAQLIPTILSTTLLQQQSARSENARTQGDFLV
jgi:hypothetical protein